MLRTTVSRLLRRNAGANAFIRGGGLGLGLRRRKKKHLVGIHLWEGDEDAGFVFCAEFKCFRFLPRQGVHDMPRFHRPILSDRGRKNISISSDEQMKLEQEINATFAEAERKSKRRWRASARRISTTTRKSRRINQRLRREIRGVAHKMRGGYGEEGENSKEHGIENRAVESGV